MQSPSPNMFEVVHYEACTVGKQPAGILLECFLVSKLFRNSRGLLIHRQLQDPGAYLVKCSGVDIWKNLMNISNKNAFQ